jgi:hypothetical protein
MKPVASYLRTSSQKRLAENLRASAIVAPWLITAPVHTPMPLV